MLGFSLLFMLLGWAIPQFFYTYMSTSYFYNVKSLEVKQTDFSDCPITELKVTRQARYGTQGARTVELAIMHDSVEHKINVSHELQEKLNAVFVIEKTDGYEPVYLSLELPCGADKNEHYKWRLYILFDVEGHAKRLVIETDPFLIK